MLNYHLVHRPEKQLLTKVKKAMSSLKALFLLNKAKTLSLQKKAIHSVGMLVCPTLLKILEKKRPSY